MTTVVFDVGKTNVKLTAADRDGNLLESLSAPNAVQPGPPYRHHDVAALERWLIAGLRTLGARHDIDCIVACAHGSGGVLVGEFEPAMPMIDYEQALPAAIDSEYRTLAGSFRDRGSPTMLGAAHLGRQMFWLETGWPEAFREARWFLATPQYWAWRLTGKAAGEVTILAAQSHLWNTLERRPAALVGKRGWTRLLPPHRPAWADLGPLRADLAAQARLRPDVRVLCGIHDSTANFYRYQAGGLRDFTVVSTGTWIVVLSDRTEVDFDTERPGFSINADVEGRPLPCMLTMGGREFSAVAGDAPGPALREQLERIVATRTFAVPSFGSDDMLFPGTAGRGHFAGPLAEDRSIRFTLAVLTAALLTDAGLAGLPRAATTVLDGTFVRDPLYAACVAVLNRDTKVLVNRDQYGTATGAALLAAHETRTAPAPLLLETPDTTGLPDLAEYRREWHARITSMEDSR